MDLLCINSTCTAADLSRTRCRRSMEKAQRTHQYNTLGGLVWLRIWGGALRCVCKTSDLQHGVEAHGNAAEHFLPLQEGRCVALHTVDKRIIWARSRRVLAILCVAATGVIRGCRLPIESRALAVGVGTELLAHVLAIHSKVGYFHLQEECGGVRFHAVDKGVIWARSRRVLAILRVAAAGVIRGCRLPIESWALAVGVCTELLAHILTVRASNFALQKCAHAKILIHARHCGLPGKNAAEVRRCRRHTCCKQDELHTYN